MAIDLLNKEAHERLLEKLNALPADAQTVLYREYLEELFATYHEQLYLLFETIAAYESVAVQVRLRQCQKDN